MILRVFMVIAIFLSLSGVSPADEVKGGVITLTLSHEQWVMAETARVVVNVSSIGKEEEMAGIRLEVLKTLERLAQTEWHITSYQRSRDQTGLTRFNLVAEGRVPEKGLNNLYQRAEELSRAGLQLRVMEIDYSPTVEEMENAMAEARRRIYERAFFEAENASKILRTKCRVLEVNFLGEETTPVRKAMEAYPAAGPIKRADRVVVRAIVKIWVAIEK